MSRYDERNDARRTDAFRAGPNFLAIERDDCINCMSCVVKCPIDARSPPSIRQSGAKVAVC